AKYSFRSAVTVRKIARRRLARERHLNRSLGEDAEREGLRALCRGRRWSRSALQEPFDGKLRVLWALPTVYDHRKAHSSDRRPVSEAKEPGVGHADEVVHEVQLVLQHNYPRSNRRVEDRIGAGIIGTRAEQILSIELE